MRLSLAMFTMLTACGGTRAAVAPELPVRADSCTGRADRFDLAHLVWTYPDGSALTTCLVYDDAGQASTTMLGAAGSPEAAQGLCTVRYAGVAWTFASSPLKGAGGATLFDARSPQNGTVYPLDCSQF